MWREFIFSILFSHCSLFFIYDEGMKRLVISLAYLSLRFYLFSTLSTALVKAYLNSALLVLKKEKFF